MIFVSIRRASLLSLALASLISSVASAQKAADPSANVISEQTLEEQAKRLRELNTMVQGVGLLFEAERNRCLGVFGHEAFCDCIMGEYPVGIGFLGYLDANLLTEAEFRDATLSDEQRTWFKKARAGRDKCVSSVIKGKKPLARDAAQQGDGAGSP